MKKIKRQLPVEKSEDVEFSRDLADREDFKALKRAQSADNRQEKK